MDTPYEPQMRAGQVSGSHSFSDLATHPLAGATAPTPTIGGAVVYVRCACSRWRSVPAAAWAAELDRRATDTAAQVAQEARLAALIAGERCVRSEAGEG